MSMTIFNKIDLFEFFISQLSLNSWKIGIFSIEKELIFRIHIVLSGNIRLLWKLFMGDVRMKMEE